MSTLVLGLCNIIYVKSLPLSENSQYQVFRPFLKMSLINFTLDNLTNDFHQNYLSLLTETKTRIAKTLFQTTAEEVADAETTRL